MAAVHAAIGAIVSLKLTIAYIMLTLLPKIQTDQDKEKIVAEQIETALFPMKPYSRTDKLHLRLLPNASKTIVCHLNTDSNFTCHITLWQSILTLQSEDTVEAVTLTDVVSAVVVYNVTPCGVNEFGQIEQFSIRQEAHSLMVGSSELLAKGLWEKKMARFVKTEYFDIAVIIYWQKVFSSTLDIWCPS